MKKDEAQKKYIEFQLLNQQIKESTQQLTNLEQQLTTLLVLEEGLGEIKKVTNKDIFVSLGSGIFLETTLKDAEKVLINIGSNTFTKKPILETKDIITSQIQGIKNLIQNIEKELQLGINQFQVLQRELQEHT